VSLGPDACCRPRKWNVEQWTKEIVAAKHMLVDKIGGVGAIPDDIRGFRVPYLSYTDALFMPSRPMAFSTIPPFPTVLAATRMVAIAPGLILWMPAAGRPIPPPS